MATCNKVVYLSRFNMKFRPQIFFAFLPLRKALLFRLKKKVAKNKVHIQIPICWVSSRQNVLSLFLLSVTFHMIFAEKNKVSSFCLVFMQPTLSFAQKIISENCISPEHITHEKMSNTCLTYVNWTNAFRNKSTITNQRTQEVKNKIWATPSNCKRQGKFVPNKFDRKRDLTHK